MNEIIGIEQDGMEYWLIDPAELGTLCQASLIFSQILGGRRGMEGRGGAQPPHDS